MEFSLFFAAIVAFPGSYLVSFAGRGNFDLAVLLVGIGMRRVTQDIVMTELPLYLAERGSHFIHGVYEKGLASGRLREPVERIYDVRRSKGR